MESNSVTDKHWHVLGVFMCGKVTALGLSSHYSSHKSMMCVRIGISLRLLTVSVGTRRGF